MSDERLTELENALFRAGRAERPSEKAWQSVRRCAVEPARTGKRWVMFRLALAACLAIGAVATVWIVRSSSRFTERDEMSVRAEPAASRAEPVETTTAEPSSSPSASAPARNGPAPVPLRPSSTASMERPPLLDEVRALERARNALGSKDPAAALQLLDAYSRKFPRGRMAAEATLLRIEALARAGRVHEADALARRFVQANPNSSLSDRARGFISGDDSDPKSGARQ